VKDHREHIGPEGKAPAGGHPGSHALQEFVEGGLAPAEVTSIQEHLGACPGCAAEVAGWQELFAELSSLPELEPSPDLQRRILAQLPPTPSLLSRLISRLSPARAFRRGVTTAGDSVGRTTQSHATPDLIQDYLEGMLAPAVMSRVTAHLESCDPCRTEARSWTGLFASLDTLPPVEPPADFADRVISRVQIAGAARATSSRRWAARAMSALTGLPGRAEGLLPATGRGWAVLCALLALPTLGVVAALGLVALHPLLSVGSMVTLLLWKGGELLQATIGQGWERLVDSTFGYELWSIAEGMLASPSLAIALVLSFWLTSLVASWVLYRNVIAPAHMVNRNV
jgi:anti-sigma factor RsiW